MTTHTIIIDDSPGTVMGNVQGTTVLRYPEELGNENKEMNNWISFIPSSTIGNNANRQPQKNSNESSRNPATTTSNLEDNTEVHLYIPQQISNNGSVTWGEKDFGSSMGALLMGKTEGGIIDKVKAGGGAIADSIGIGVTNLAGGDAGQIQSQHLRNIQQDAQKQFLFEGSGFRSFEFIWDFKPRSKEEVSDIYKILTHFRGHMYPDFDAQNSWYVIPNTYKISYWVNGIEQNGKDEQKGSSYLHKFKPSVITSCNVVYGSDGVFGTHHDGAPTSISLTLSIQEINQVTSYDVLKGGY